MTDSTRRNFALTSKRRSLLDAMLRDQGLDRSQADQIPRRGDIEHIPLSVVQERMWLADQIVGQGLGPSGTRAVRISGSFNVLVFQQVINEIVDRHEILRTTYLAINGQPVQQIARSLRLEIPQVDLSSMTKNDQEREVEKLVSQEAASPFDMEKGPLMRFALIHLDDLNSVLF